MYPDNAGREHMTQYAQSFLTRNRVAVLVNVQQDAGLYLYKFAVRELKK